MSNFQFVHDFSDSHICDLFQRAMEAEGLIFDGNEKYVSMDGKTHYVKVQNGTSKNKIKKSAWYKGYIDDFPAGSFGWFHGSKEIFSWSLWAHCKDNNIAVTQRQLSQEEQAERAKELERIAKNKERAKKEQILLSGLISKIEYFRALPLQPHNYLNKKNLEVGFAGEFAKTFNPQPYTAQEIRAFLKEHAPEHNKNYLIDKILNIQEKYLKYRQNYIFVTGYNLDFDIVFFQLIAANKNKDGIDKWFPKTFIKLETFGLIGPKINENTSNIIICEGWATALSIAKFINFKIPVLIAWDSGNMRAVAIKVRSRYKHIKIWSANDNDHTKPLKDNAGLNGGQKLCSAVGAYPIPPDFDPTEDLDKNNSDWNDMELCYGLSVGRSRFTSVCNSSQFIPAEFDPDLPLFMPIEHSFSNEQEAPVAEIIIEPIEFTALWLPTIKVASLGIQYLDISYEDKVAWFQDTFIQYSNKLQEEGIFSLKFQLVSHELDQQVDDILLPFAAEIAASNDNLFLHIESVKNTIYKVLSMQLKQDLTVALLSYIRDIFQTISNPKFANSVIEDCLKSTDFFIPRKSFFTEVLRLVKESQRIQDFNEHLTWSALMNMDQSTYWEKTEDELVECILNDFCSTYNGLEAILLNEDLNLNSYSHQESKLKYLDKAYSDLALMVDLLKDEVNPITQLENQILYILKLVNRINETENTVISADVCIISNLSLIIDEILAKNQYEYIKKKFELTIVQ
jgi:phage/plasmid primase-like uncharacterized protein